MRAVLLADGLWTGTHDVMRTGGIDAVRSGRFVSTLSLSVVVFENQILQVAERRFAGLQQIFYELVFFIRV